MHTSLATAAGIGAVTGLRSMVGLAATSRALSDRPRAPGHASRLEEWLSRDLVAVTLSALALGELVADKLPGIPDRVAPGPLIGRGMLGGVLGAVAAGPDQRGLGVVLGTAAAVAGAYLGWFLRREAARVTMLPDPFIAIAEDAIAITAATELARLRPDRAGR